MEPIELDDIQRLVIQGYSGRDAAAYGLLTVTKPVDARAWLEGLLNEIDRMLDYVRTQIDG